MLRSATAAHLFASQGINTRCAGTEEYAIQPVHENTLLWADKIFVMEQYHADVLNKRFSPLPYIVLNIPDIFYYNDSKLKKLLEENVYEYMKRND